MNQCLCNYCGRNQDQTDTAVMQEFRIHFLYGSRRDMTQSRFHLCAGCLDILYDKLREQCKIAPEEWELF